MHVPDDLEYLTIKQAAALIQITPDKLYDLVAAGKVPSYVYGTRNLRIKRSDLFRPSRYSKPNPSWTNRVLDRP